MHFIALLSPLDSFIRLVVSCISSNYVCDNNAGQKRKETFQPPGINT